MKQTLLKMAAVFAMTAASAAMAQDWAVGVGANYRIFNGGLEFKAYQFQGATGGGYVNGTNPGVGLIDIYSVPTAVNQVIGANASLDTISFGGGSTDLDNAPGVIIAAERKFYRQDGLSLGLNLNFLALTSNADTQAQGTVVSDRFTGAVPLIPGSTTYTYAAKQNGLGTASTMGFVNYAVDLNAYTLGVGLSGAYEVKRLGVCFGFGPTLTLATMDTDFRETVQWDNSAPVNPGQIISQRAKSDHNADFLLGAYASLGLAYKVSESVTVCLEYRYDHLFNKIDNDVVKADLSGGSVQAKIMFIF